MREQRSGRSNDRGGTQSTLSHQRPSAVISGHQHSHSHSGITFTLSSDASRRLRSTQPVIGFMREQRSGRSNDRGGTQSTLSHQRPSVVINGHQRSSATTTAVAPSKHSKASSAMCSCECWSCRLPTCGREDMQSQSLRQSSLSPACTHTMRRPCASLAADSRALPHNLA